MGPTIRRGYFVCRNVKLGDFILGNDAIEELDEFMRELPLPSAPARNYDPNYLIRDALKQMRNYNLPSRKNY